ncbi:MAG: ABC transporter ATP-binding protein [Phycisphaerales bacterium]
MRSTTPEGQPVRSTDTQTRIEIKNLTKAYPAQSGVATSTAVDRVSLEVEPGELFFLLGPSGCGKTTLLRMIAGFTEPTSGSIVFRKGVHATDVTRTEASQRNTALVFQSYALWPHLSVADNVGFGLDVRRVDRTERERRVQEALDLVQMGSFGGRKPVQLSGGQQQRVALARAIVVRPDVLLLDEPLSNLDSKLRLELRLEIRRVCKQLGMTAVYVTHDQKEALSMADRLAVMRAGKVVAIGAPRELYQFPRTSFVAEFLGETNLLPGSARSGGGIETPIGALETCHPIPEGEFQVSIRPESILFRTAPGGPMTCHVEHAVFLGDSVQLVLRTPGGTLLRVTHTNPTEFPAAGQVVSLHIPPSAVVPVSRDP